MRTDHDQLNETPHSRPRADRPQAFSGRMAVGLLIAGIALLPTLVGGVAGTRAASAAEATVNLGTATPFSVLAGAGVTNTGPTVLGGDLGTCPTPAITGFPPGVANGTTHANDAVACQAKSDLTIAYDSAAGRAPTTTYTGPTDLGGSTLTKGVYKSPESLAITGTVTLDAQLVPDAVFIFQAASTLITATDSSVRLINGAQACNVFWQVGSSSTLGVNSTFAGTVMALASITANHKATVDGRLLARNGAVTLDANKVNAAACATGDTPPDGDSPDGGSPDGDSPSGDSPSPSASDQGSSATTNTQPASTATTAQGDSTSSAESGGAPNSATDTSGPATAAGVSGGSMNDTGPNVEAPAATLARTGSPIAAILLLAALALLLGSAATSFGRTRHG